MILALDTATRQSSVALCDARGGLLAEAHREVTTHSEGLLPMIHEILGQAGVIVGDLTAVACGRGPGSFTGLRIGMATAKGICLAADLPLICVSSLLPLGAAGAEAEGDDLLVAAVLDARRKEVFCGLYRGGRPVGDEVLFTPADLVPYLQREAGDEALVLAGDGALLYREVLLDGLGDRARLAADRCHQVRASHMARAAAERLAAGETDDLLHAEPLYIRASDAKLPKVAQDRKL